MERFIGPYFLLHQAEELNLKSSMERFIEDPTKILLVCKETFKIQYGEIYS